MTAEKLISFCTNYSSDWGSGAILSVCFPVEDEKKQKNILKKTKGNKSFFPTSRIKNQYKNPLQLKLHTFSRIYLSELSEITGGIFPQWY